MKNIDFLPAYYRELTVRRRADVWRILLGGMFIAALAASGLIHRLLWREAQQALARRQPQYDQAQSLIARQADMQKRLAAADAEAELLTYLRHPWPATQVLAAALADLPDSIRLQEVRLYRAEAAAAARPKAPPDKDAAAAAAKLTAADRDLAHLREQRDAAPTVLLLSGLTTDSVALQRYLVALGTDNLFAKAELNSLEASGADPSGALRFTARLIVRPGYGQPEHANQNTKTLAGGG